MRSEGVPAAPFDWKRPNYAPIMAARFERLRRIRANPAMLSALAAHYRERPAQFMSDWGMTLDPRNPERGLPASIPFVLFPKQTQLIEWIVSRWRAQEHGIVEKSRDVGASWIVMALAATLCLFHRDITVLIVSRKEDTLDRVGDPGTLFAKARAFMQNLPAEFTSGWRVDRNSAHLRLTFPSTGSSVVGATGDQSYRGGRASIAIVDEAAFLERPALVDAALSAVANCRIDVSTPNGRANSYAERRFGGRVPVFTLHWRDDPRKSEAWYQKQCATLDPVTVARELDLDYLGSVQNQLIPAKWVQSAIGAHIKLGIEPTGTRRGALDVADAGNDLNAFCGRHGIVVEHIHSWSGKGSDIYASVVRAFMLCDGYGYADLYYDADGLGSGVRGDARRINEDREKENLHPIRDSDFRGSAAPCDPENEMIPGRKNKDFFANAKAQAWWALRMRFQATHRAIEGQPYQADDIISLDPQLEELTALCLELSQPTFSVNSAGKLLVDKQPEGTRSPNLADAVMIAFNPSDRALMSWIRAGERHVPQPQRSRYRIGFSQL